MIHFFHGLIGDHRHFAQVAATCLARGMPSLNPDIPFLTTDYVELLRHHTTPTTLPAVRVGNSIGCGLALATAGPNDRLILTAPPFDYSRGSVPLGKAKIGDWVRALYVQKGTIPDEAAIFAFAEQQMLGLMRSRAQIRRLRHYKQSAQSFWNDPALRTHEDRIIFVIGQEDFTTPVDAFSDHVAKQFPNASLAVWEECGHAVPLDASKRIAALVSEEARKLAAQQVENA